MKKVRFMSLTEGCSIAAGGMLGAVLRAIIDSLVSLSFPVDTILVNLVGCGLIAVYYGIKHRLSSSFQLFHMVGFCGSFTTVSLFTQETVTLLHQGHPALALMNVAITVGLSLPLVLMLIPLAERRTAK